MKISRFLQRLVFLVLACFLVAASLFLLQSPPREETVVTEPLPDNNKPAASPETKIVTFPEKPAPGDFLLLEAGPLTVGGRAELQVDFPATASEEYLVGDMLYILVAICYDTEPGLYNLVLPKAAPSSGSGLRKKILIVEKEFPFARFSMPAATTAGWTAQRLAEDREKIQVALDTTVGHPLWMKPFLKPLEGRTTSSYGAIRVINSNPPRRHGGIDIGAEKGTPVAAANCGIVRLAEYLLAGGNTVIIDHGLGLSSSYMHLDTLAIEEGRAVSRGDIIGTVGMTGYATGPHLHWEVNIGRRPVNPEQLLLEDLKWLPAAYTQERMP